MNTSCIVLASSRGAKSDDRLAATRPAAGSLAPHLDRLLGGLAIARRDLAAGGLVLVRLFPVTQGVTG